MADKNEWQMFFNGHAPEYDDNCFTKNTTAEVEFLIGELGLPPGASILDIGCGTGRHAIELARRGYSVTGLDLSPGMLEQAQKKAAAANVRVTWRQANAADFSMDDQFDAAICLCEGSFGLLSGTDDPIRQPLAILRNVAEAMKPEAKCLFTVLSACRMIRSHSSEDVASGAFDTAGLTERNEHAIPGGSGSVPLRERGFVATELVLLFRLAGLDVQHIGGGTAGNWGKRPIEPDEYEIMVIATKRPVAVDAPYAAFGRG